MADYVLINGELYHHGIKGMKWGRRRWQNKDGSLTPAGEKRYNQDTAEGRMHLAKDKYKQANKEFNRSYDKAYNKSIAAYSPIKKHREANDRRWDDAWEKGKAAKAAREEYKQAKKEYKAERKEAKKVKADNMQGDRKFQLSEKQKKAIKIGAAVAGTALVAYGAYKVSGAIKEKNFQIMSEKGKEAADAYWKRNRIVSKQVDVLKDGTARLSTTRGDGTWAESTFANAKAARDWANKIDMDNLNVDRAEADIYKSYLDRASNASLKEATKNVYDYYRKRRK